MSYDRNLSDHLLQKPTATLLLVTSNLETAFLKSNCPRVMSQGPSEEGALALRYES